LGAHPDCLDAQISAKVSTLVHACPCPNAIDFDIQRVRQAVLKDRTLRTHLLDRLAGIHAIVREEQFSVDANTRAIAEVRELV